MRKLGMLERAVMDVLWDNPAGLTARELTQGLPQQLAMTTVLTVLDRLRRKGLAQRASAGRWYRYSPAATRAQYTAALMVEALGNEGDSHAVLEHFVLAVSPEQMNSLRRLLDRDRQGDS